MRGRSGAHLGTNSVFASVHVVLGAIRHCAATMAAGKGTRRAAEVVTGAAVTVTLVPRLLAADAAAVERVFQLAWHATRVRLLAADVLASMTRLLLAHRQLDVERATRLRVAEVAHNVAGVVGAAVVACVLADFTARKETVGAAGRAELKSGL